MSVFAHVIARAQQGMTLPDIARDLGITPDLARTIVAEAERLGLIAVIRSGSGLCGLTPRDAPAGRNVGCAPASACATCPIRPLRA